MNEKVTEYIEGQESPQREICLQLRRILFKTFPDIGEEIKWGVPSYGNGKFYFVALKSHVNLGFSIKGMTKQEIALYRGSGKTMRTLSIKSEMEIDEQQIDRLLRQVRENP